MADQIQNSINKAIDTIIQNRVNSLTLDKTVIAIIDSLVDPVMNIYRVKYDGGYFNAKSNADVAYIGGMAVYVQIPQNDMTKEKLIIGRAYATKGSELANSVISAINSYSIMGGNLLLNTENELPDAFGLRSYHDRKNESDTTDPITHRAQYLVSNDIAQKDYFDLDDNSMNIYRESATGLMLEADFRTALSSEQKNQPGGTYGIALNLVFENSAYQYGETEEEIFDYFAGDIKTEGTLILNPDFAESYTIYQEEYVPAWEIIQRDYADDEDKYNEKMAELDEHYAKVLEDIANEYITVSKSVKDYATDFYNDIASYKTMTEIEAKNRVEALLKTDGLIDMYISYIEAITNAYATANPQLFTEDADAAINSFLQLLRDIKAIYSEDSALSSIYNEYKTWADLAVAPPAEKTIAYVLDSNHMTGSPFEFSSWSTQYEIFNIDFSTFKRIDSIIFFKDGFLTDNGKDQRIKEDIFVKDIKLYALQPISAINGDYSLKLTAVDGFIFPEEIPAEEPSLKIRAQVFKQYKTDLSDKVAFQWFKSSPAVTSVSYKDYRPYGGFGWAYLERKGNKKDFTISRAENAAYENKYKCVAIIDASIVLSQEFTIYNEAISDNITITSTEGTLFTFDNGTPVLKTLFYDKKQSEENGEKVFEERIPTPEDQGSSFEHYTYVWSVSINGQKTFLDTFAEDIQPTLDIEDIQNAQRIKTLMQGVKFYKGEELIKDANSIKYATRLEYPVRNIAFESNATFECYVLNNGNEIGSASITLQNQTQGAAVDYSITIEGGEQIFQYDEYGGAPNDEKLKTPQEIKPLVCHFFNPTGLEVGTGSYRVEWILPIENTLITTDTTLQLNSLNNEYEIDPNQQCVFGIAKLYNESSQNNQITCRVIYNGNTYSKTTNMFFGKVGSNGTNGTDMVLKIEPVSTNPPLDNQPLTLYRSEWDEEEQKYKVLTLNDGTIVREGDLPLSATDTANNHLRARLFQKNDEITGITRETIRWNVAGSTQTTLNNVGKYLQIESGKLIWSEDFQKNKQDNFIIRAWIRYLNKDYYAFYNLPIIEYQGTLPRVSRISVDKKFLLKDIVYNADGRNPIYSHTQGVKLNNIPVDGYVTWEAIGGSADNQEDCFFSLLENKDANQGIKKLVPYWKHKTTGEITEELTDDDIIDEWGRIYPPNQVYILPADEYDGGYCNNRIIAKIYKNDNQNTLLAKVTIPIHMSLNTFGLASLNAWDGTSVTVDEEGGYIMAPQVGAGEKDDNNRFTGVVMGKTETYTGGAENEKQIGLLGYSHGLQSIFLDSQTGEATFGLPGGKILTQDGNNLVPKEGDDYGEGRIELRPGGVSKVGGWQFGKRALYYTTAGSPDAEGEYRFSGRLLEDGYSDKHSLRHVKDIYHEDQGILLSADPAYISIKGRVLTAEDFKDVDTDDRQIKEGESLELQLDPDNIAMFAIYRHFKDFENNNGKWTRQMLSGINAKGQLVANNLKQSPVDNPESTTASSLGIDPITAFEGPNYIGLNLRAGGDEITDTLSSFFRAFVSQEDIKSRDSVRSTTPLYITGGQYGTSDKPNDYSRPISIHGKTVSLWASNSASNIPVTDNYISIGDNEGFIGIKNLSTTSYYVRNPEYSKVTPIGTENPHEQGWYEFINEEYILTEDTQINPESEKIYYYISASEDYAGAENNYVYNVYDLYDKEIQYFDDNGNRVIPKEFNFGDTTKWEYHTLLEDSRDLNGDGKADQYWDVLEEGDSEEERSYPLTYPYEPLAPEEGSEDYKIDPVTKEKVAIDPLTGLPIMKIDADGKLIKIWTLHQFYKDLTAEVVDYWWLETTYLWVSDGKEHDTIPVTGAYTIITRYKSFLGEEAYPPSEFGSWYASRLMYIRNDKRPEIDDIPEETINPLEGWTKFKSQNKTHDRNTSSFLFLNQRNSKAQYSDTINGSLLYAKNALNLESNFGKINLIARGDGDGRQILFQVRNSGDTESLTELSLLSDTGSKNGIFATTQGQTILKSANNIELYRNEDSYLKIYDGEIDLRTKNNNTRLHLLNSGDDNQLHTQGNLALISNGNQINIRAVGAAGNDQTPGIELAAKLTSNNVTHSTILQMFTFSNSGTTKNTVFKILPTDFPSVFIHSGAKPYTVSGNIPGNNYSNYTGALVVGNLGNSNSISQGGIAANWGYIAGTLHADGSTISSEDNLENAGFYSTHSIVTGGNFKFLHTWTGTGTDQSEKHGSYTSNKTYNASGSTITGLIQQANNRAAAAFVHLPEHTHPFSKTVVVNLSQSKTGSSVSLSGSTITVYAKANNGTLDSTVSISASNLPAVSITTKSEKVEVSGTARASGSRVQVHDAGQVVSMVLAENITYNDSKTVGGILDDINVINNGGSGSASPNWGTNGNISYRCCTLNGNPVSGSQVTVHVKATKPDIGDPSIDTFSNRTVTISGTSGPAGSN